MKNIELVETINALQEASDIREENIWRVIANELNKAKRKRVAVNLSRINRFAESGEIIAIPGKVLGSGLLEKPLKIAAFTFSISAKEKIKWAKGESLSLVQLLDMNLPPSKIRIMK
jgi:large subunit ribosomal protein L18e